MGTRMVINWEIVEDGKVKFQVGDQHFYLNKSECERLFDFVGWALMELNHELELASDSPVSSWQAVSLSVD